MRFAVIYEHDKIFYVYFRTPAITKSTVELRWLSKLIGSEGHLNDEIFTHGENVSIISFLVDFPQTILWFGIMTYDCWKS